VGKGMRIIGYNLQTEVDATTKYHYHRSMTLLHHLTPRLKLAEVICESENATGDGNPEI